MCEQGTESSLHQRAAACSWHGGGPPDGQQYLRAAARAKPSCASIPSGCSLGYPILIIAPRAAQHLPEQHPDMLAYIRHSAKQHS